jgi:hypothetical protein
MEMAMRYAVYLRFLGADPVQFRHRTYSDYATALQQQYDGLLRTVDPAIARQARITGRALIRKQTLPVAAGDLFCSSDNQDHAVPMTQKSRNPLRETATTAERLGGPALEDLPTSKDMWNCRRKIHHRDYLSAMQHAAALVDRDLQIYPCNVCMGLHVGHDPNSERQQMRKQIKKKLNLLTRRLDALENEKSQLEDEKRILLGELSLQSI